MYIINYSHFVAPESSFTHSQQPTICTFSEPDKSSPGPPNHTLKIHFNIIKPPIPRTSKRSLKLTFPYHKTVCKFPVSHTCHMSR